MRSVFVRTGFLLAMFLGLTDGAGAVVLNVGDTARVDYSPGALGPGTPPFAFIALGVNFDASDPFGPHESLSYKVYAPDNTLLGEGSTDAGDSVYTSGLFAALTLSVFPSLPLGTTSFYATVTDTQGSFDLTGGQADLYNFSGGVSQFASVGVVAAAVPGLSAWAMLALGFGGLGLARVRKRACKTDVVEVADHGTPRSWAKRSVSGPARFALAIRMGRSAKLARILTAGGTSIRVDESSRALG